MRYFVVIIFFYLLLMVITSVSRDARTSSSSSSLIFLRGRRALKWSISYKSQPGNHNLEGFSFGSTEQAAERGVKSTDPEKSKPYSTETPNSSNMDVEDIVYHIDYHGATTHPTPTPKHPKP